MAALMALALWSSGLPLDEWWARARGERTDQKAEGAPLHSATVPDVIGPTRPQQTRPMQPQLAGTDSSLSQTPQPLYLVAISAARSDTERTAQIGTAPSNPQTYSVGAILANGARLVEIRTDHVVLEREGKRLALYLAHKRDTTRPTPSEQSASLAFVGGNTARVPSEQLTEDRLTEVLRAMPFYENEMLSGMQAFPGRAAAVFAQLGLEPGDVIVALNGAPIADAQAAGDVLRMLTEGAALTASVRRHGAVVTVALDGAIVVKALAPQPPAEMLAGAPTN